MVWTFTILSLLISLGAIGVALKLYRGIMEKDPGDETMQKLARAIQVGASRRTTTTAPSPVPSRRSPGPARCASESARAHHHELPQMDF